MSGRQGGPATRARRGAVIRRGNRKLPKRIAAGSAGTRQAGMHPMPLRSTIRRTNIIVGATVAVVVFALSVTGVVLAYELRSIAGAQGPSHPGWDAKRLATFAGHAASRGSGVDAGPALRTGPVSFSRSDAGDGGRAPGSPLLDSGHRRRLAGRGSGARGTAMIRGGRGLSTRSSCPSLGDCVPFLRFDGAR